MKATQDRIKRIKVDAAYGKKRHYNAADRFAKWHVRLGIPLVALNVLTGSALVYVLLEGTTGLAKYVPLTLSFTAALLAGIQTFFNIPRRVEGHRRLGGRYLTIMKRCDRIQAYVADCLLDDDALIAEVEEVARFVEAINRDAEAFPTSDADYRAAQKGIEAGEESYTEEELEL